MVMMECPALGTDSSGALTSVQLLVSETAKQRHEICIFPLILVFTLYVQNKLNSQVKVAVNTLLLM